jgi:hypothetical protein
MKLVNFMGALAKLFPKPPIRTKERKKEREREIVSRYGRGNASLQLGMYITEEEIKQKKENLASYHF